MVCQKVHGEFSQVDIKINTIHHCILYISLILSIIRLVPRFISSFSVMQTDKLEGLVHDGNGYYLITDFGYTRAESILPLLLFTDNVQEVSVHGVCAIESSSYV